MKFYGQLENASLENLSNDPTQRVAGRFYLNTTTGKVVVDDGTALRPLLRADGKAVFGTDSTASNNVRFHHAGVGLLQFVTGDDQTAENSMSTSLAQVGMRISNLAALPAPGNAGRLVYNTTTGGIAVDTGSLFLQFATLTGQETLTNKTLTAPIADVVIHTDLGATPSTPASGLTKVYTRGGTPYKLASDGIESVIGAGGNVVNTVSKSAAYTASASDGFSFNNASSAGYTITIPAASANNGVKLTFQKTDATFNVVTIGSVTTLNTQGEQVTILSNGTTWFVIDRYIPATWTSYTMTIGAPSAAPTKPTARVIDLARWRRNGGDLEISYLLQVANSTGASQGAGIYTFPFPAGPVADAAAVYANTTTPNMGIGWVKINDASNNFIGQTVLYSSTSFAVQGKYSAGNNGSPQSVYDVFQSSSFFTLAITAPYVFSYYVKVPIVGWNT